MLLRGFAALSLALTGGSAFTKNCRPSSLTTLAICAFAPRAKKDAQKIAQDTSVPRRSRAVIVLRLFIMPLRLGIHKKLDASPHRHHSFRAHRCEQRDCRT